MPTRVEELLARVSLFDSLSRESRRELAAAFERREVGPGETVFETGDPSDALFFVAEGRLTLLRERGDEAPWVLARLEPGDLFGELGLFDDHPRQETARADRQSVVLELPEASLERLTAEHPLVALKLHLVAAQGHRRLVDLSLAHAQRSAVRYRVHRPVLLVSDESEHQAAVLVDLSETGARIAEALPEWRPGASASGTMTLDGQSFEIAGTIVWRHGGSVGLAFDTPRPELLEFVQKGLSRRAS